jgi:hypothetical protein
VTLIYFRNGDIDWVASGAEAILKTMWSEGHSATKVAEALNLHFKHEYRFTKNSVLGRIKRLPHEVREELRSPEVNRRNQVHVEQTVEALAKRKVEARKVKRPTKPKPEGLQFGKQKKAATLPPPKVFDIDIPGLTPLVDTLLDLAPHQCRWPADRGDGYCGRQKHIPTSYCCTHFLLSLRDDRRKNVERELGFTLLAAVQGSSIVVKGPVDQGGKHHRQRAQTSPQPGL